MQFSSDLNIESLPDLHIAAGLALPEDVLAAVEKPGRYIGQEVNSVIKDKSHVKIRFAMCFPDVYEIGMSHLGIQIIYDMLNSYEDTWCERVYSPWTDLDRIMRREKIPLFALESQDPVREFQFLGITIQYEMCYTNILQVLDLSGIPLLASKRGEGDPIVIGGGPCTCNPEPVAPFFDLFYIGEAETRYRDLLDLYNSCRETGLSREEFLLRTAREIPGMYVPRFYDVSYREDGTLASFLPNREGVPARVRKEVASDLDAVPYPRKPVVPYLRTAQDKLSLEILRGCIRGCRFCQAGQIYKPVRVKRINTLVSCAADMLNGTGYEELSLNSLSSSDYPQLKELLDALLGLCSQNHVNLELPSLRVDTFSLDLMGRMQDVKKSSLTFAPEAGSQRLRDVINKGLTEDDILRGSRLAFESGWSRVKLYFMLGLPMETEEDVEGIADLCEKICSLYYECVPKEKRNGAVEVVASTAFFVPKPFTAFQWAPVCTGEQFLEKAARTKKSIQAQPHQKRIRYRWHEADMSEMEGAFARGDRRLADVILCAYQKGALYDAWGDTYDHARWLQAFADCGLDPQFYISRERGKEELFPWDFLDYGVDKDWLWKEWERAKKGQVTANCRQRCQGCGAAGFGAGLCVERGSAQGGGER